MTDAQTTATTTTGASRYYAQPYDLSGTGFWFSDYDTFCEKLRANRCEEFELQYIDGEDAELWNACGADMSNLSVWFDVVQQKLDDWERLAFFYCCDVLGYSLEEGLEHLEDYTVTEGTAKDYAEQLVDECGNLEGLPENLRYYFDYDAFARDMVLNGEIAEFEYNGTTYTATA